MSHPMKVIGIGLPKTGTTTLGRCFEILGFGPHVSWNREVAALFENGNRAALVTYAASFGSFEDYPWCMIYKELDQAFPGSKFIYTVRKDHSSWLESRRKHAYVIDGVYYARKDLEYRTAQIDLYRQHDESVRRYFAHRPNDCLEVCWEHGHGWATLAPFLERPIPLVEFPHYSWNQVELDDVQKVRLEMFDQMEAS